MKKLIIIGLGIMISLASCVKIDAAYSDEYREAIIIPGILSNSVNIENDYCGGQSFGSDKWIKSEDKLLKFNSVFDPLNIMVKEGWVFMNAFPMPGYIQNYNYGLKQHSSHLK